MIMNNRFDPAKFYDHTIVDDDGAVVGHIRVKPSGVLWAPANAKVWYGLPLDRFAAFAEAEGKKQKK
jgi:hypothetical protein